MHRIPIRLLLAVAALALLLAGALFGWAAWQFAILEASVPLIAELLRIALLASPLVGGGVGLAIAWRRYGWRDSIAAHHQTQLERARTQVAPLATSFHYEPQISTTHMERDIIDATPEPLALPGPLDLATLDIRPTENRILLALDQSGLVTVSVEQLCHVALLGSTGGGKSNILRLIIPQIQAFGAAVCLADPHYAPIDPENGDDWRLIEQRLRFAPAITASSIDQLLDYMTEELARRLERRNRGERVGVPMFLAFDELPTIADMVPTAVERIGRLLREGRKVHLLTIGASQSMLVKEVGGSSALRDQYRTAAYVGGDKKSAAAILDIPERLIDDGPLGKGVILLRSEATKPARLVRVPLVSNEAIAALLGGATSPPVLGSARVPAEFPRVPDALPMGFRAPVKTPAGTHSELTRNSAEPAPGAENITSTEYARIVSLFYDEGLEIAEIVRRIWPGVTKGRQTQDRSRQVQEVIRLSRKGVSPA